MYVYGGSSEGGGCWVGGPMVGVSEAGSSDRLGSALRALIETYCQSDKRICMQCVFQDVLFSAAHHSVNQPFVTSM